MNDKRDYSFLIPLSMFLYMTGQIVRAMAKGWL